MISDLWLLVPSYNIVYFSIVNFSFNALFLCDGVCNLGPHANC
jgi:hypothetical protein